MTARPLAGLAARLACGPLHRRAALGLFLLLTLPPAIAGIAGLSALSDRLRDETAAAEAEAALYRVLAARRGSMEATLAERQATLSAAALFPEASGPGPALAALQSALGDRAAALGAEVTRILPGEPEESGGTTWLRLGIEIEADAVTALDFLSGIETGTPLILFRRAEIRRLDRTDSAEAGTTRLRLVLDLAAPWRAGQGA